MTGNGIFIELSFLWKNKTMIERRGENHRPAGGHFRSRQETRGEYEDIFPQD